MPSNSVFHFKQFSIQQDQCAMKVTSDACIFGAWIELQNDIRILDVGTGTGLLALMAAQKSESIIDALEIDADAANQARENVWNSSWRDRIKVYQRSLQEHAARRDVKETYDVVVCNPPFYDQERKSQCPKRRLARHSETLNLNEIIDAATLLLKASGSLFLLVPYAVKNELEELCAVKNMYSYKSCSLSSFKDRPPYRLMAEYRRKESLPVNAGLIVYQKQQEYSEDCKRLLAPYFQSLF